MMSEGLSTDGILNSTFWAHFSTVLSAKIFPAIWNIVDQDVVKRSRKNYFKGMKELADKKFIAETMIQNYYFINPGYMFNGHRLTYMKTYYLKDKNE